MANLFYQVANRSIELALDARCPLEKQVQNWRKKTANQVH
jgi:hypothetical protein